MIFPDKYTPIKDSYIGQLAVVIDYLKNHRQVTLDKLLIYMQEKIHPQYSPLKLNIILFILHKLNLLSIEHKELKTKTNTILRLKDEISQLENI